MAFRIAKSEDSQALVVDVNSVRSIYPKDNVQAILDWINKDCLRVAVDKEKALNYLHLAAPIAAASDNQELSLAAKVIKDFENPKLSLYNLNMQRKNLVAEEFQPLGLTLLSIKKMVENANVKYFDSW